MSLQRAKIQALACWDAESKHFRLPKLSIFRRHQWPMPRHVCATTTTTQNATPFVETLICLCGDGGVKFPALQRMPATIKYEHNDVHI